MADLRRALWEDRAGRDRTTRALFPRPAPAVGEVVAQADGTLSGVAVARELARLGGVRFVGLARDGEKVHRGRAVLRLTGDLRRILPIERTLLNYLMHLSGVATATSRAVRAVRGGARPPKVFATRKTLPGLRDLEKAAVVHGGGRPHRRDLAEAILVKTTHLQRLDLEEAVARAMRRRGPNGVVQVEVRTASEAVRAVRAGAGSLLIDNQGPAGARAVVRALVSARLRSRTWVELSGGITPANVVRYRTVGADAVSLGALTHSAVAVPFHLVLRGATRPPAPR